VYEFIEPIVFRIRNLFTVLSSEIQHIDNNSLINIAINGGAIFIFFFFISRFFKAYLIRLGFFLFGAWVLWSVSARSHIIESFDFYGGLGIIAPQLDIPELTYLILKERFLLIYYKLEELVLFLISPFIWFYRKVESLSNYIKSKQAEKRDKNYFDEDFREKQKQEWQKEQAREDEKAQRDFKEQEQKRKEKKQQQKQKQEQNKKTYKQESKKEEKKYSRWDSDNPYIILGVPINSTKEDIKKAYRRLAKIYHPDLSLINKKEAEEIFKKINSAYESLINS